MNSILDIENTIQSDVSENRRFEISEDRAKLTGLVCIGCAAAALLCAFLGVVLPLLSRILFSSFSNLAMKFYFVFFLVSAAIGVLGYSEIKAVRSGLMNSIFQLVSLVLLSIILLFVLVEPTIQFSIIYGIFVTFIPLTLTVLTLINNKTAVWKSFVPLAIPLFHVFPYFLFGSSSALLFFPPLAWSLLGIIAYVGRK